MIKLEGRIKCPFCYALFPRRAGAVQKCFDCGREFEPVRLAAGSRFRLEGRTLTVTEAVNHPVVPIRHGFAHETFRHPDLETLRKKYRLDEVGKGRPDEFGRQLALRDWVSAAATSGSPSVRCPGGEPGPDYHVAVMLEKARRSGHCYFCTYKALASVQLASAFGWTARLVNCDGQHGPAGPANCGHMVYEIWSNQFNKWYLNDSLFNVHYEKEGRPLSIYELRREFLTNRSRAVRQVWGPDRYPMPREVHGGFGAWSFEWYVVYLHNNFFDFPPGDHIHPLLMVRDRFNRNRNWRRFDPKTGAGRGNVYVCKGMVIEEADPYHLNYPINQAEIRLLRNGKSLKVRFHHNLPNFSHLEAAADGRKYRFENQREAELEWTPRRGEGRLSVRGVNTRGVAGPESRVVISSAA
ncbi:MAG: hypothetical protein BWY73_01083 [candidate division TA06 bacterium ADurb.Bin417]|uniref:Transglutaminase-like domain-containing protein n=1 Tax=candidate division TA06 bacterium ADurb.Bin417 TaxID=1852828 RepID=A0A1V5MED3_UNCT6|nr:MAG: hypothetical protein BWY73_01083 [candidate division TA06 bacterium ADurb.Bin417]